MDHLEFIVDCATCGAGLADDFYAEDEDTMQWHAEGKCRMSLDTPPKMGDNDDMADYTDLQEVLDFLTDEDRDFETMFDGREDDDFEPDWGAEFDAYRLSRADADSPRGWAP